MFCLECFQKVMTMIADTWEDCYEDDNRGELSMIYSIRPKEQSLGVFWTNLQSWSRRATISKCWRCQDHTITLVERITDNVA